MRKVEEVRERVAEGSVNSAPSISPEKRLSDVRYFFYQFSTQVVSSRVTPKIVVCFSNTQAMTLPALLAPEEYLKMNPEAVEALCGYNAEELKAFEQKVLDKHNYYRRRHNNYPLKFSKVCTVYKYS